MAKISIMPLKTHATLMTPERSRPGGPRTFSAVRGGLGGAGKPLMTGPVKGKNMNIPSHILEAISKGECTLFFGAGASNPAGAPSGDELSDLITEKFLVDKSRKSKGSGPLVKDWGLSLASAVSLSIAQPGMDRGTIEKFVRDKLSKSSPSPAHLKIPWFRWRAIVTTNYDCLIEEAYEKEDRRVQELITVIKEKELPSMETAGSDSVPLLKPHGCVSRSMSLSWEDVYKAKQERRLLFTYIEILHFVGPVIYIGYSFRDVHILDMILDLTNRLGLYRKPILFVTLQRDSERAEKERNWIQGQTLNGIYLADGFEQFMDALCKQVTPAIAPSMIIRQMAPCRVMTFASGGVVSDTAFYKMDQAEEGEWEYWVTYSINDRQGYAGVIFERRDRPRDRGVDISAYGKVIFELNVPRAPRKVECLEVKLEGTTVKRCDLTLDVKNLRGAGWKEISIPFGKQGMPVRQLRRVVLADNGNWARLGREYKIGIRKIRFE